MPKIDLNQSIEILSNMSNYIIYNKNLGIMYETSLIDARDNVLKELNKHIGGTNNEKEKRNMER